MAAKNTTTEAETQDAATTEEAVEATSTSDQIDMNDPTLTQEEAVAANLKAQ